MLERTHIVIRLALGLYFLPFVSHKLLFIPIVLASSVLPDIDSLSSQVGRKMIFRPVQVFLKHRGVLHSYTFCIFVSLIFALLYPIFALPFFLGYSFHLLADSFSVNGIRPFWPLKFQSSGVVKTGEVVDKAIFYVFVMFSIIMIVLLFR